MPKDMPFYEMDYHRLAMRSQKSGKVLEEEVKLEAKGKEAHKAKKKSNLEMLFGVSNKEPSPKFS